MSRFARDQGTVVLGISATIVSLASLFAQAAPDPSGGWAVTLERFGPFAPFALLCIVIMKIQNDKTNRLEKQLADAQALFIDKVVPALTESTSLMKETSTELTRAAAEMRSLADRPGMDPDVWRRILSFMERYERRQESQGREA